MKKLLVILLTAFSIHSSFATPISEPKTWFNNFLFHDKSFIFEFIRTLGYAYSGGADLGESVATANNIQDGNILSWYQEWFATANRLNQVGESMQALGQDVSARGAFFRASNYYRTAAFYMDAPVNKNESIEASKKSRESFLKAIHSLPYIHIIKIPYEKTTLPGYFLQSDLKNAPLLIIHTGFDGTAEELFFEAGLAAYQRGYNVILFEGPGQGSVLREQHLFFRYDWEKVVSPVIDFAITLPNIDKNKIALMGISFGGYLAPRAAAFDQRIKALIANPGLYDFGQSVYNNLPPNLLETYRTNKIKFNEMMDAAIHQDNTASWFFQHAMWVFNAKTPADVMSIVQQYTLKDVANKITCPSLIVTSNEDSFDPNGYQARKLYNAIQAPKTLLIFTPAEAAEAHCQMGAIAISNERIFSWLNKQLKGT